MSETTDAEPITLFNEGRLIEAIAAAKEPVRAKPADATPRGLLAELLCVAGEYEKADGHLETAMSHAPHAAQNIALMRQLIRAATARKECLGKGRPPELVGAPSALLEKQLQMLLAQREGDAAAAERLALEIEAERPRVAGKAGGVAFADLRDADETWTAFVEVLTSTGKYYWVATASIASMNVLPPKSPRDLLWAPCEMIVRDGPEGTVFLPVIYHTAGEQADESLMLGRETRWTHPDEGPVRGSGQRVLLLGDEEKTLFELQDVVMDEA